MFSRITFLVFLVFWLGMTYLLWRSEYAVQDQGGSAVPVSLVWRKILNAPDTSSLQILHNGHKMGYCRWSSSIGQDLANNKILTDDTSPPATPAPNPSGIRLDLEGNVLIAEAPNRLQVHGELRLQTNDEWQEFNLRLALKPDIWEIHSLASAKTVRLQMDGEDGKSTRTFTFADLQNPQTLLREFNAPAALALMGMMHPPGGHAQNPHALAFGLEWKARNDWVSFGHTSVRAFRLEAVVLDHYRMRITVSRVGEILRVDLPDGWELINDQLVSL